MEPRESWTEVEPEDDGGGGEETKQKDFPTLSAPPQPFLNRFLLWPRASPYKNEPKTNITSKNHQLHHWLILLAAITYCGAQYPQQVSLP